ncbi:MAG TPA: PTS sugar transporter subunit IIA, partial [Phycisphaerales bacterium]|nr:PTS sugar transporter subunit IIA [Phycisphaerales bacterium]
MKLNQLVPEGAILPRLASSGRDQVVEELVGALVAAGAAPAELRGELVRRVLDREDKASTGFGKGVAVPHVRHPALRRMAAAIGLSDTG